MIRKGLKVYRSEHCNIVILLLQLQSYIKVPVMLLCALEMAATFSKGSGQEVLH